MDSGLLKGPAELLASKVKAFKNCLGLATECLSNKDYVNAKIIYGGILTDLHNDCIVEALNLNDLDLFSLHSCFAYSSIGSDYNSEQALVILNSIHKPIKLPLVPYLKAFVHISNDRLSFAHDELQCCKALLENGYNFKSNNILNQEIIPEINDDFLKMKINGLNFVCDLLQSKEGNEERKRSLKEHWMKIGKLCDTDFVKPQENEKEKQKKIEAPPKETIEEKREKIKKSIKVTKKAEKSGKTITKTEIAIQTIPPKRVTVGVQTTEKEVDKQLLNTVLEIRNKMNNMQNKKDNEIKQLQKKNNELTEKLLARDTKRQEKSSQFEFFRDQITILEKKYEQSQKQNEILQKLLVEQFQQKYNMQKNIYQLFEEKCDYKIIYLSDIQKYLHPADRPTPHECKEEVAMWQSTLNRITGAKRDFEVKQSLHCFIFDFIKRQSTLITLDDSSKLSIQSDKCKSALRTIDDLIVSKRYSTIRTSDWPGFVTVPNDVQDIIYRNFKVIMQQSRSFQNHTFPKGVTLGTHGVHRENEFNPNQFVNGYNTYKEDGRTTGSPVPSMYNSIHAVSAKLHQYSVPQQAQYSGHRPQQSQPQTSTNKKCSPPPSSTYKSEQELLTYLQSNFKGLGEIELQEITCHVRENLNGGSLIGLPRKVLVEEIKRMIKKSAGARSTWNDVSMTKWHNDHSDNKCCICFEDYNVITSYILPCQHEFHKECITNWLKRQSACPVCRVHSVIDEEYPPLKA